ncbi:hypothetical protein ATER59S_00406 [Aquamicrobium terrae]
MEFVVAVTGVLGGKVWTWFLARWLGTLARARSAPAALLLSHIAAAAITGVAINVIESRLSLPGHLSGLLSKGLIVGVAWSPWFVAGARVLRAHHHPGRATAYLLSAPVLSVTALLGGYLSTNLEHSLI